MVENKNLKLKLGLCGLALTSFLAINAHSTVHADTVDSGNANQNAITWDSDQDDSQVVKEEPQQDNSSRNVQTQGAVQSAPAIQSVQSNNQKRAEKSAVRVSSFDTSTVNRNNVNNQRNNANVKVATVHDTSQMPVQKQKVAQFNQGSQIYTLNGSNQLSKNNGDGYVITNAGTYNGRAVDIGVTINNVQDNQSSYTTKWSNGDTADVTGKLDNEFSYQNSALVGTTSQQPQVDTSKAYTRTVTQMQTFKNPGYTYCMLRNGDSVPDNGGNARYFIAPQLLADVEFYYNLDTRAAAKAIFGRFFDYNDDKYTYLGETYDLSDDHQRIVNTLIDNTSDTSDDSDTSGYDYTVRNNNTRVPITFTVEYAHLKTDALPSTSEPIDGADNTFIITAKPGADFSKIKINNLGQYIDYDADVKAMHFSAMTPDNYNKYGKLFKPDYTWTESKPVQVTDHLQVDKVTNGSLGYNYTVGLYDAQTGDLITDLKAEYKGQTGTQATSSSSVMNNAIKSKIQQINQGHASVSYTGTSANDDVAFYQETRQVNPQSTDVNRKAQRVIHVTFPNGVKPASYDGIVDQNNNIVQTVTFTRTGTENIVSGQKTYGPWQQRGGFNAVTLPDIPGYTMTTTGV